MSNSPRWHVRAENDCLFVADSEQGGVILQHNVRPGVGAYIHPLRLDGVCLTADSPWHHPHQHGIQTRFVGIDGSDFWHYPGQRPGQTLGRINPGPPRVAGTAPPRWTIEALCSTPTANRCWPSARSGRCATRTGSCYWIWTGPCGPSRR